MVISCTCFSNCVSKSNFYYCVLAGSMVFLEPAFGPYSGVMLEADSNLEYPDVLFTTYLFELSVCAADTLHPALFSHAEIRPNIREAKALHRMA